MNGLGLGYYIYITHDIWKHMEKTLEVIVTRAQSSRGARMHLEFHRFANSVMWSLATLTIFRALCII